MVVKYRLPSHIHRIQIKHQENRMNPNEQRKHQQQKQISINDDASLPFLFPNTPHPPPKKKIKFVFMNMKRIFHCTRLSYLICFYAKMLSMNIKIYEEKKKKKKIIIKSRKSVRIRIETGIA